MKEYYKAILDNEYKGKFWFSGKFLKVDSDDPVIIEKISKGHIMKKEPEKVVIEKALHPCPKFGEIEILHEHRGQRIVFSAWKDDKPLTNKSISFRRDTILYNIGFYDTYQDVLKQLIEGN
ncbi:MAG TPA: hypothetical protein DCY12_10625 [Candidatus Atribacteria bacterium]|nr:hypothetical protein [Candidatus Atribacteria bacterium]